MEWAQKFLETQGLAGAVILGLSFAVVALWRQNTALHEKRVAEAREVIRAIEVNTAAIETQADAIEAFRDTFNALVNTPRIGRGK